MTDLRIRDLSSTSGDIGNAVVPSEWSSSNFSHAFSDIKAFITAGLLTTAALSNHSHGNPTLNLTNLSGTTASASNGFTLSLSAADPLLKAGTGFTSGGNGVGLSGTLNTNGLSLSATVVTTWAASNHSHGNPTLNLTNLSGTTASASNGFTLSLSGPDPSLKAGTGFTSAAAGSIGISGTQNTNGLSLSLSVPAFLTTAAVSTHSHGNPTLNLTNLSGTTASASNGLTLSLSAADPALKAGTGFTSAGANISLSGTLNTNGLSLSASVSAAFTRNNFPLIEPTGFFNSVRNATIMFWPFAVNFYGTGTRALMAFTATVSTSTNSSHAGTISAQFGIYTKNVSTLSLATSGSTSAAWTNTSNNSLSLLSGMRNMLMTANINLTPGEYWCAALIRTSTANANWFSVSVIGNAVNYGSVNVFGSSLVSTVNPDLGLGYYSTSTNALPASVAFSEIIQSSMLPYIPTLWIANSTA